jgi:hypothetical protein
MIAIVFSGKKRILASSPWSISETPLMIFELKHRKMFQPYGVFLLYALTGGLCDGSTWSIGQWWFARGMDGNLPQA